MSSAAVEPCEYLNGIECDIEEIELPDLEDAELTDVGAPVALIYADHNGDVREHRFRDGAQLLVADGVVLVADDQITLTDLGIED